MHPRIGRLLILAVLLLTGCAQTAAPESNGRPSVTPEAIEVAAALTQVTGDRKDLLFRYKTEAGFASATRVAEIPEAARGAVQVIDLSASPEARGAARKVQVFDLRQAGPEGRFSGRFVARTELESALAATEEAAKPKQARITMYSASWCGVCKKARAFMTKEGLAFVEKDIEKDAGAARELKAKAAKAGVTASGVPVFDIGGRILSGFDPKALMAAARK